MSTKRKQAISDRRRRIFDAARSIIGQGGLDGLTTRGLAQAAGVTVPTLYNLVGGKDAILEQMVSQNVETIWERLDFDRCASPLDMADAIIDEAYRVVRGEKVFHRAIWPLMMEMQIIFAANLERDDAGARAANRCVEMAEFACAAALEQGMLRGNVTPAQLAQQMFIIYRGLMLDWFEDVISVDEMLRRQRRAFYLILAADASDEFRDVLFKRIAQLNQSEAIGEAA